MIVTAVIMVFIMLAGLNSSGIRDGSTFRLTQRVFLGMRLLRKTLLIP